LACVDAGFVASHQDQRPPVSCSRQAPPAEPGAEPAPHVVHYSTVFAGFPMVGGGTMRPVPPERGGAAGGSPRGNQPLRVGLTGSIGSGKSSVARLLRGYGAAVIDADSLARQATEQRQVLEQIAAELGRELVVTGE